MDDDEETLEQAIDRFESALELLYPATWRIVNKHVVGFVVHTPEELLQIETTAHLGNRVIEDIETVLRDCLDDYESEFLVTVVEKKRR